MSMSNWKFAVKSIDDISRYHILIGGVNCYTGETEADYIAKGYAVLTEPEFDAANKAFEDSLCGRWVEISAEFYDHQLNVLPPLCYYNGGFYVSEAYTADIHDFCQELNGKYYSSLQRTSTKRDRIIAALQSAIAAGRIEKGA